MVEDGASFPTFPTFPWAAWEPLREAMDRALKLLALAFEEFAKQLGKIFGIPAFEGSELLKLRGRSSWREAFKPGRRDSAPLRVTEAEAHVPRRRRPHGQGQRCR